MTIYAKIRAFHTVAEKKSFSAAAAELGVGQPIISKHIGELEKEFDVQLFKRRGRQVSLTEEGIYLFSVTKDYFADEALAIEYLSNIKTLTAGHLKIKSVTSAAIVAPIVKFNNIYPRIEISFATGHTQVLLDDLIEQNIDIGFAPSEHRDSRLDYFDFELLQISVLVPDNHNWQSGSEFPITAFQDQTVVLPDAGSFVHERFKAAVEKAGVTVSYLPLSQIGDSNAVEAARCGTLAIGWENNIKSGDGFLRIPIEGLRAKIPLSFSCLKTRKNVGVIKAFFESLHTPPTPIAQN
jgi:DNA-binding transcriptional LysR family regulator